MGGAVARVISRPKPTPAPAPANATEAHPAPINLPASTIVIYNYFLKKKFYFKFAVFLGGGIHYEDFELNL